MSSNIVNQVAYLPTTRIFPEEIKDLTIETNRSYIDIANAVNNRTIGIYPTKKPAITGENWFLSNAKQQSLRQVYTIPSITFPVLATVAHGINVSPGTVFTHIYGVANRNGSSYVPIPHVDPNTLANGLTIVVGPTDITLVAGSNVWTGYNAVIVLEWLSAV